MPAAAPDKFIDIAASACYKPPCFRPLLHLLSVPKD
jgi:hypothetical protein